jgi:2-keto-3-deoxy-L-rhamnonate aldolase RhmA
MRHDPAKTDNPLVRKLATGDSALCLAVRLMRLPHVAHMAKAAGFDALYMDMEHSMVGVEDAARLCLAAWDIGVSPLVRVPSHDAHYISRVLDGGAAGVIVPHIETAAEAEDVVRAALFAPLGKRSVAGSGVVMGYDTYPAEEICQRLNERTLIVAMLESEDGIANAESIAAVPGVDMLLIGTNDLCAELGVHGQHEHPKVRAAYETVAKACRKHNLPLGIGGIKTGPMLPALYELGARFLMARTDEALLLAAAKDEAKVLRQHFAQGGKR